MLGCSWLGGGILVALLNASISLVESAPHMKTAEEWFQEGLDALALTNEFSLVESQHNMDDALRCFEQALAIDPKHVRAIRERGLLLWLYGRYDEALDAFVTVSSVQGPDHAMSVAAGNSLLELGRPDAALGAFEEALRLDEALFGSASALMKLQRNELALVAWDELLARPQRAFRKWPDYLVRCTRTMLRASTLARLQRPEAYDTFVKLFTEEAAYLQYVSEFAEVLREHEVARRAYESTQGR
jgi:tetratricopeptide (TPR) repeat protein